MFLSLCHTIIIDRQKGTYNAASPDELALANAAKQFGFEFKGSDSMDRLCVNEKSTGKILKYKLLNVLEVNSTRKRRSVIVEDANGVVVKETLSAVDECARIGLRTLFLAEKILDDQEYQAWNEKAEAARLVIKGRDEAIAEVDEIIEKEMELIGSTAIEDRL